MQDSNLLMAQQAHKIETMYRPVLARRRLRGLSTFLFFVYQEGDPQCEANAVPFEAQMLIRMSHEVLDLTLRRIDDTLSLPWVPRTQIAAYALNEACVDTVIAAVWKRREYNFRVLEPDLKWLSTIH